MRTAIWASLMLALLTGIVIRAQQAPPAAGSGPAGDKPATEPVPPADKPQPAAVSENPTTIDGLPLCPANWSFQSLPGVYKVGPGVKPPYPTYTPEATFSNEARKMIYKQHQNWTEFQAVSVIGLIVSAKGKPQDLCVMRSAGFGLDKQAFHAVEKYSFRPAMINGIPVAVRMAIDVNFKLY
jgi:hypothetical protein